MRFSDDPHCPYPTCQAQPFRVQFCDDSLPEGIIGTCQPIYARCLTCRRLLRFWPADDDSGELIVESVTEG